MRPMRPGSQSGPIGQTLIERITRANFINCQTIALSITKCIIYLFQTFFDSSFISSSVIHLSRLTTASWPFARRLSGQTGSSQRARLPADRYLDALVAFELSFKDFHSLNAGTGSFRLEDELLGEAATSVQRSPWQNWICGRMRLPLSIIFAIHYLKLLAVFDWSCF